MDGAGTRAAAWLRWLERRSHNVTVTVRLRGFKGLQGVWNALEAPSRYSETLLCDGICNKRRPVQVTVSFSFHLPELVKSLRQNVCCN
jgi:hypothetical protein